MNIKCRSNIWNKINKSENRDKNEKTADKERIKSNMFYWIFKIIYLEI